MTPIASKNQSALAEQESAALRADYRISACIATVFHAVDVNMDDRFLDAQQ
jgi:hypothetical protein